MYCDIPSFNRCCFCLPLRYGLLAYGYIKLILLIAFLAMTDARIYKYMFQNAVITIIVIMIILDFCLTVLFVFGGHTKRPKILLIYMWYCIVSAAAFIILQVVGISLSNYASAHTIEHVVMSTSLTVVIQVYLIFSIRSEIIKLVSNKEEAIQYNVYDPSDSTIKLKLQCGV